MNHPIIRHLPWWSGLIFLQCLLVPVLQAEPSFPTLSGRVVDQANLLDNKQVTALTNQLEQHEQETGNQVVVVTVKSLQGYSISDFTNQLARHWQIGQADINNGVVLLVAPQDRKVRIEVGYGLEGALTDAISSDIIRRRILPAFREDDYPAGIQRGIDNVLKAIAGEYKADPTTLRDSSRGNSDGPLQGYFPLLFIAFIALTEILKRFGWAKAGHTAFPASILGIFVTAISGKLWLGLAATAAIFILLYFFIKPDNGAKGHHHRYSNGRNDNTRSGGFGGGSGGFSGGGGSFGGGGASGGW